MEKPDVIATLTPLFRDLFDDETLVLTDAMTAEDVPGWTSMAHINLILSVEETFEIKIASTEIEKLANVAALIDLIVRKTA